MRRNGTSHNIFANLFLVLAILSPRVSRVEAQGASATTLDVATQRELVEEVAALIAREYVVATVAERVAATLRQWSRQGTYDASNTTEALARHLTVDLLRLSADKHLAVTPLVPKKQEPVTPMTRTEVVRRSNGGVQRVEILSGNVGYLNLTAFWRIEEARDSITEAMRLLRRSDALIIDMRQNGGGSPETVALLIGHLFEREGLALFDIVSRTRDTDQYKTPSPGVAERSEQRPLYVLVGPRTFSAGEGFAFLLQERERAEVIGERTAGAANPGASHSIRGLLQVTVPNGIVQSAHSRRNWEGAGVVPNVAVSASDALALAHARALSRLGRTAQ